MLLYYFQRAEGTLHFDPTIDPRDVEVDAKDGGDVDKDSDRKRKKKILSF